MQRRSDKVLKWMNVSGAGEKRMDLGDIKDVVGIIDRTVGSHSFNGQVEEEPNKKTENEGST